MMQLGMRTTIIFFFFAILLISNGCRNANKKDLAAIEKQELATGIRHDSIFMGIYLSMKKQDFFDYCWGMNKKGLFTEGVDMTVEHQLAKKDFFYPLQMNFYPKFKDDKIRELPINFTYKGIDLSFPNGQTEKLLNDVKKLVEEWYGSGFFVTTLPDNIKGYAKVSGNRRVVIFSEKEFEVMVVVTDLAAGQ